jgi:hypothetical protein
MCRKEMGMEEEEKEREAGMKKTGYDMTMNL